MSKSLSASAKKVQKTLKTLGFPHQVVELPNTTRSAKDAAQAIGCRVEQIAKSLIFKAKHTKRPILVIASGPNRVNEMKIAEYLSEPVEKADAEFVHQQTGFSIGGVPPVGHLQKLVSFIDEDLLKHKEIWAAAGNPNAVFMLTPDNLLKMTGGSVVSVN